jgi:hypothetical protein
MSSNKRQQEQSGPSCSSDTRNSNPLSGLIDFMGREGMVSWAAKIQAEKGRPPTKEEALDTLAYYRAFGQQDWVLDIIQGDSTVAPSPAGGHDTRKEEEKGDGNVSIQSAAGSMTSQPSAFLSLLQNSLPNPSGSTTGFLPQAGRRGEEARENEVGLKIDVNESVGVGEASSKSNITPASILKKSTSSGGVKRSTVSPARSVDFSSHSQLVQFEARGEDGEWGGSRVLVESVEASASLPHRGSVWVLLRGVGSRKTWIETPAFSSSSRSYTQECDIHVYMCACACELIALHIV